MKDQHISPISERDDDSYQALFNAEPDGVRFEWDRPGKASEPPATPLFDNATLDGFGDLPEDFVEDRPRPIANRRISLQMSFESRSKSNDKGQSKQRSPAGKASINCRSISRKDKLGTLKEKRWAVGHTGAGDGSGSVSGGSSSDGSPSFSEMTFNDNGSLVTKRGGKEAHKTLNRAFERIYNEKLCSK